MKDIKIANCSMVKGFKQGNSLIMYYMHNGLMYSTIHRIHRKSAQPVVAPTVSWDLDVPSILKQVQTKGVK